MGTATKSRPKKKAKGQGAEAHSTNQEAEERRKQTALARERDQRGELFADSETKTPLGEACVRFTDVKEEFRRAQLKYKEDMKDAKKRILGEMKKAGKEILHFTSGQDTYVFEIIHSEDDIRCSKTTKTPTPSATTHVALKEERR